MNIETLVTILVIAFIVAVLARMLSGFTLAGWLASFMLACLAGIGGWLAQERLNLPRLYSVPFPTTGTPVSVVWAGLAALAGAAVGSLLWRPAPLRRRRTRR